MSHSSSVRPPRPASYDKKVALVLQGGGALGSYQAGVYAAMAESDYLPDWVAGISIGAINAALIAGNAPDKRVERLREFWEGVTECDSLWRQWAGSTMSQMLHDHRPAGAWGAIMFGTPGFFTPRAPLDWMAKPPPTSFYDTSALKSTLERLVDFDRINARETRISVGAVNVRTGNFAYFDSDRILIRPEHIMASGALPPGFPAVEIDGEHYWDGGLVSNTPLHEVLTNYPRRSTIAFQVDLFPAQGRLPESLAEVSEREKDIRYSSRTRTATTTLRMIQDLRHNVNALLEKLPPDLRGTREAEYLYNFGCVTTMDIVQLVYLPAQEQGYDKDYEFSRQTMQTRWEQGRADMNRTLDASPWLEPMSEEQGARSFDVLAEARKHHR